jgi:hypothetical protein
LQQRALPDGEDENAERNRKISPDRKGFWPMNHYCKKNQVDGVERHEQMREPLEPAQIEPCQV